MEKIDIELDTDTDTVNEDGKEKLNLGSNIVGDSKELKKSDKLTWEDTWIYQKYKKRQAQGRDLVILIIGENSSTGTGKTTLAVKLGDLMDCSTNGLVAKKATPYVDEFFSLYKDVEQKSCIIADEAQGLADNRKSMTNKNVNISQIMTRARFREVYTILTMPDSDMLDKRIKKRADVLIVCQEDTKGKAKVYELWQNDLDSSEQVKTKYKEKITWGAMDDHPAYEKLSEDKENQFDELLDDIISDNEDDDSVSKTERITNEAKEKAKELYGDECSSYSEVQEHPDMPDSPKGSKDKWSKSTLSSWLSDN